MNIAILAISTLIVLIVFGIPVATHPQWFKSVEEEIEEAKREGHIVTAKPLTPPTISIVGGVKIDDALAFIPLDNIIGMKLPNEIVYP